MSTAQAERRESNKQEGANKKQKTTLNDDETFLKKVSSDPDRAFKTLCDFRSRLLDVDPAAAKQAMDEARDGKCAIADCNNILDGGSWDLVADDDYADAEDPTKREVVGKVSFRANDGRISLNSLRIGGFRAYEYAYCEDCSAYAETLAFEISYLVMDQTKSGMLHVYVVDGKSERDTPYQFPKAKLCILVDAAELDLPECYGSLLLVKNT